MFGLHLLLALGLATISGGPSVLSTLTAFVLVQAVFHVFQRLFGIQRYVACVHEGARFGLWFIVAIFRASLDVARWVLAPKVTVMPAIVRFPTRVEGARQQTLLAALISLTPGTLALENLPEDEDALYIHVLNAHDEKAVLADLRDLETRLLAWLHAGQDSPTKELTHER